MSRLSCLLSSSAARSVNFYGTRDWCDGKLTMSWRQEPLVRCHAYAELFWMDDIEPVGIMPDPLMPMGHLTRAWLRWRRDPEGQLQAQEACTGTMKRWGQAQDIGRANFDDVVYVLSRSEGVETHRLLWLRSRIWWDLNDRYRCRPDGSPVLDTPTWRRLRSGSIWRSSWLYWVIVSSSRPA